MCKIFETQAYWQKNPIYSTWSKSNNGLYVSSLEAMKDSDCWETANKWRDQRYFLELLSKGSLEALSQDLGTQVESSKSSQDRAERPEDQGH